MENFASLFEQKVAQMQMNELEIIDAIIVSIDGRFVAVDAGLKSISYIPVSEFRVGASSADDYSVGDSVKVVIEAIEDGYGETRLSKEKAEKLLAWLELEEALEKGLILTGTTSDRIKGGLSVNYKNVKLFLPGSLIDIHLVTDFSLYKDREIEFKVIKIDKRRKNIVVSRVAALNANPEMQQNLAEKMQPGNVVKGTIKNITDYGAFVDLGGIDGLLYITDLSWRRIKHPSDVVTIGQEVEAVVLNFDKEKHRVSLGLKQLLADPWNEIQLTVGDVIEGVVSNITDYGLFAEIYPGIEGLIHISEVSWTNKNINPNKVANVGDPVKVKVLEIDSGKRRIGLGMKQCMANPWDIFAETHHVGDDITGVIRSITDFGVFVGLENGIDGLVHISDLAWGMGVGTQELANYKKGQEVTAKILDVNPAKERIALSIKLLQLDNPYYKIFNESNVGDVLDNATVVEIHKNEAILKLDNDVLLVLPAKEVTSDLMGDNLKDILKAGEVTSVKIIALDSKNSKIIVTTKLDQELSYTTKKSKSKDSDEATANEVEDVISEDNSVES